MSPLDIPQADNRGFWVLWGHTSRLHARIFKLTGGRVGGKFGGAPVIVFEGTGRKSGKTRTHAVVGMPSGDDLVVVAARGGVDRNPAWYHNLMASPETDAWSRGGRKRVRAREAEGEERERLWCESVELNPVLERYAERTDRRIPVIVLEPAG